MNNVLLLASKVELGKILSSICNNHFSDVQLHIVETEQDFWKRLKQNKYSASIISNNSIPVDAIPAIIKNLKIHYSAIPVICISGYDLKGLNYLPLPLNADAFINTMKKLIFKI